MKTSTSILGIGSALPQHGIVQAEALRYASSFAFADGDQARKVKVLYRRSGIERRGSVLLEKQPDASLGQSFYPAAESPTDRGPSTSTRNDRYAIEAPKLAVAASRAAIEASATPVETITHLITVSCTGFNSPGIDIALIDGLQLNLDTQRVQIGFMGCHAAINGLRTAEGLAAACPDARVLICCVELCSLHFQYGFDTDRIVSGAIFADGATAMILGGDASSKVGTLSATGSYLVPESRDAMTWRIGDHGYEMTLSAAVPDVIKRSLKPFLTQWLKQQGESIASIGGWAVHPGGVRILTAVEHALELPGSALEIPRMILAGHGNMSSATMPLILEHFLRLEQPKPWLMLGFGPGLEVEVALIR